MKERDISGCRLFRKGFGYIDWRENAVTSYFTTFHIWLVYPPFKRMCLPIVWEAGITEETPIKYALYFVNHYARDYSDRTFPRTGHPFLPRQNKLAFVGVHSFFPTISCYKFIWKTSFDIRPAWISPYYVELNKRGLSEGSQYDYSLHCAELSLVVQRCGWLYSRVVFPFYDTMPL